MLIFLNFDEECTSIKFYDPKLKLNESYSESKVALPRNKNQRLNIRLGCKDQLLLVMSLLILFYQHISWLFRLSKSTKSWTIIASGNLMCFTLSSMPIWPSKSQIVKAKPTAFKGTYPSTCCINRDHKSASWKDKLHLEV